MELNVQYVKMLMMDLFLYTNKMVFLVHTNLKYYASLDEKKIFL